MMTLSMPLSLKVATSSLTFKAPRKMHLKMSSAEVVCCKKLPNITGDFKYTSKKCGPKKDCSYIGAV